MNITGMFVDTGILLASVFVLILDNYIITNWIIKAIYIIEKYNINTHIYKIMKYRV